MILKAIGKYIDTLPIADLLSQDEALTETIVFEVDRFYKGEDLSVYTFMMRGITESGGETESELTVEVQDTVLHLCWQVGPLFTTEAGSLSLDLFAFRYTDETADRAETPPDYILRYQLPPVTVRGLPDSDAVLESRSYTAFLLEVKAAANDAIAAINSIVEDFEAQKTDYDTQIASLEKSVQVHTNAIGLLSGEVETHTTQIQELQLAVTPTVALTQSEFNALETPAEDTLYVIRADA